MRTIYVIFLCLVATSSYAGQKWEWVTDASTGCKIWAPEGKFKPRYSWSGNCVQGIANGQGVFLIEWHEVEPGRMPYPGAKPGKQTQTFEGVLKGGMMEKGSFTFPDGAKFVGEFRDAQFKYGTYTFPNSSEKYVGEFKDGRFDGKGTYTEKSGDTYSGSFYNGKEHGEGTFTFKDGKSYKGLWENGKRIKVF